MHRTLTNNDKFTYTKSIRKNNNSRAKINQNNEKVSPPCPIKPSKSIIPKDINLQKIFTTMLQSSYDFSITYSNLTSTVNIENSTRKKLFKKIREFFISNIIEYRIYFKTILLFDIILIENEKTKLLKSTEEIAIGALMLSVKFNYNENKMFSMKKFLKFYDKQIHSLHDLIEIERKTLKAINYFLNYTTPRCFLEFFILNGIIYNVDNLNQNEYHKIYSKTENVLEKIMEESNNYLKFNFFYLTCSVVSYCRQSFRLEKWPFMLRRVFSIDFCFFQNEYNAFFSFKERERDKEIKAVNNMKNDYSSTTYNCHTKKDIIINGNNNIILLNLKSFNNSNSKNNSNTKINNYKENEKNYKNNNFNIYKRNNFKTINHFNNNIINININNVSLNNIYNSKMNKNTSSNRFHYNSSNNTINEYYNNNKDEVQQSINLYDGIYIKSISKNKYKSRYKNRINNYKSTRNLEEIKEVKDFFDLRPYISPHKRKRRYFYLNKVETDDKENINQIHNNQNEDYQVIKEEKNDDEIMNNDYDYKRKNYTYNKNSIKEKIISSQNCFFNNNNSNKKIIGHNYIKNIAYNKNNITFGTKEQSSNDNSTNIDDKSENNLKFRNNANLKNINSNDNNFLYEDSTNKSNNNIIYERYLHESEKNKNSIICKCESSRYHQSYNTNTLNGLLYADNKESNMKINDEDEFRKNMKFKNYEVKEKERLRNKKIKFENKIKYNDLIKYKLAMSYSINKRK